MNIDNQTLIDFIEAWVDGPGKIKEAFLELMEYLQDQDGVSLEFLPRPGVTYSLRGVHVNQNEKPLFVMVDVIEGEPRWLSVCFYSEMISDPEGVSDFVPGGLLGEDAMCFDLEEYSEDRITYLCERIKEAFESVS